MWFAYTGLKHYASKAGMAGAAGRRSLDSARTKAQQRVNLWDLAELIKHRTLSVGKGFKVNDTTPLNEHYNPNTGAAIGAQQFSWTAAHLLMWASEGRP